MNFLARIGAVALAVALCACGGGGGAGGSSAPPPPASEIGQTQSFAITSTNTAAAYPIDVYLPPQYDAASPTRLPVIYAVDGDARFGYPGGVTRFQYLRFLLQQHNAAAVLVGVGGTARRNTDDLPPGNVAFHTFLTQELVPRIDATYHVSATNRILSGLSYGGTIVYFAFLYEAAGTFTFKQFWSTEVSNVQVDLLGPEAQLAAAVPGKALPVRLFLGTATTGFKALADSLNNLLASRHYPGLDIERADYPTDHVGTDAPAFEEALARFLNN